MDRGVGGAALADAPGVTTEEFERATAELNKRVDELGAQIATIGARPGVPADLAHTLAGLQGQVTALTGRPDLAPAVEEIREQVADLGTRITRDLEPHIRNVEGRLDALTTEVGALAGLRVDFDTRMRAETIARTTALRDADTARDRLRAEVVGWVGNRHGRTTTLTDDVDAAAVSSTGARNWGQLALALAVTLLFVGGWGFFRGFPEDRAAKTQTALAQIVGEMGGLDTSKPSGQQLVGWHQTQDRLESVEGTTLALADEANRIARSAEAHRVTYGLKKALPPENVLYGWKDAEGKWHLGAMEQANNAQATAYRVGEVNDDRAGIPTEQSRAEHYALAENPYANRAGDLERDSDPVKAYRAKRR